MPDPEVTVVIPTLCAGSPLVECLESLERQTLRDFQVIVVDNSGKQLVRTGEAARFGASVIENARNEGYGAAVNAALERSAGRYVAVLNDDAAAHPRWLEVLVSAAGARPDVGMFASQVLLAGEDRVDSAGMLLCADGSSKQRGHLAPPSELADTAEVLFPSGSAAFYRRVMLDEVGAFDGDFFLYCEDTDLGLRARWAGWKCLYVPEAVVEHRYSQTAGRVSPLKAYYVERNRIFVALKNFPAAALWKVPFAALGRYFWHALFLVRGRGSAARFHQEGNSALRLAVYVARAHLAALAAWPRLRRKRRAVRRRARISSREFLALMRAHAISPKEVAAL